MLVNKALLSQSERQYIEGGVEAGLRADGRAREEWRAVSCELEPVPQAVGSARVRVGGTDVLVSIKGDVVRPTLEAPNRGHVVCYVDSSSLWTCTGNSANEDRQVSERNAGLTAILTEIFVTSGVLDTQKLCIVPGQHCWALYVDALILDYDGNLVDTLIMATRLAIASTRLPTVRIEEGGEATEIVLSEDVDTARSWDLNSLPIAITLFKIGHGFIIDASAAEEACSSAALLVATLPHVGGKVVAVRKLGFGLLDASLLPSLLITANNAALSFSNSINVDKL